MTSPHRTSARTDWPPAIHDAVIGGLRSVPKSLPPKLFYDEAGAKLFERITTLDVYYLTRAELEILEARASEIAALAGKRAALIEYGSGAGRKVRVLLDALDDPATYVPVDISREQLDRVTRELALEYPRVTIRPVCADYTTRIQLPDLGDAARRVAFYPGSTIGNFHPPEATIFLRRIRQAIGPDGALILGLDRLKDRETLDAAYNDPEGVTAAFNLNLLTRINRELSGDFDLRRFAHRAFFNAEAGRIEMHLESLVDQTVHVAGETFTFERGETIWTESSYKFDEERAEEIIRGAGFEIVRLWTDSASRFWVAYLVPTAGV